MLPATFGRGFSKGLRNIRGKDRSDQNKERIKELLWLMDIERDLDDEVIKSLAKEICHDYFQGHSGGFWMAYRLKEAIETRVDHYEKIAKQIRILLRELLDIMCDNLRWAVQVGNEALNSIETSYWVADMVYPIDPIAAERLMRDSGKQMLGEPIDEFFWRLKKEEAEKSLHNDWALRSLTEGILKREQPIEILTSHLLDNGRGPKI